MQYFPLTSNCFRSEVMRCYSCISWNDKVKRETSLSFIFLPWKCNFIYFSCVLLTSHHWLTEDRVWESDYSVTSLLWPEMTSPSGDLHLHLRPYTLKNSGLFLPKYWPNYMMGSFNSTRWVVFFPTYSSFIQHFDAFKEHVVVFM